MPSSVSTRRIVIRHAAGKFVTPDFRRQFVPSLRRLISDTARLLWMLTDTP